MTLEELTAVVVDNGMPRFNAKQIAAWIYRRGVTEIDDMTDLSKKAREWLKARYKVGRYAPSMQVVSNDGTEKYLFTTPDELIIESVYIPDGERATLCVSSQSGCRMNCRFCMTGRLGLKGNISTTDIINQVLSIPHSDKLTNIVFMGMGEPMDNFEAVKNALEILTAEWGLAWSPRRITVSTVGKADNLRRLLDETKVHVAFSLHTPFPTERERLMPVEKAYGVESIINLLSKYDFTGQRRCSMEYIMWRGINDDLRHARELVRLLSKIPGVRVNLIRFHAFAEEPELQPCSREDMERFRDFLSARGVTATIRASRGEDILAACGMLAGKGEL